MREAKLSRSKEIKVNVGTHGEHEYLLELNGYVRKNEDRYSEFTKGQILRRWRGPGDQLCSSFVESDVLYELIDWTLTEQRDTVLTLISL
jgi:hypothetical protein